MGCSGVTRRKEPEILGCSRGRGQMPPPGPPGGRPPARSRRGAMVGWLPPLPPSAARGPPRRAAGPAVGMSNVHMDPWPRCLERLEAEFPVEDVHTWLRPLQAARRDDATVLYAPNAFVRDAVNERYMPRIRELLGFFGSGGDVSLEIGSLPRAAGPVRPTATATATAASAAAGGAAFHGNLDNHYTFDNFVEGRSNQLGRAATWQAAQKPGERAHNPLLLYGGTGLGKTHLMFAAGNEMRRNNPSARVLYMRSNDFYSAFFRSLQKRTADQDRK